MRFERFEASREALSPRFLRSSFRVHVLLQKMLITRSMMSTERAACLYRLHFSLRDHPSSIIHPQPHVDSAAPAGAWRMPCSPDPRLSRFAACAVGYHLPPLPGLFSAA